MSTSNIFCIWYPSGGFGHFINAVLTLRGENFLRPKNSLKFSANGDSHSLDLVVPKYFKDCWYSNIEFLNDKNYAVLVDNGINNEHDTFRTTFPNANVIKLCYSDYSWPVVARTMIDKAMGSSIEEQLPVDNWNTDELWARREKYFLFLRDHNLRHTWKPIDEKSIDVGEIYDSYDKCCTVLNSIVTTDNFYDLWSDWRKVNAVYIDPVMIGAEILSLVVDNKSKDISHIRDLWTQAVVYYYIWIKYNFEVPHNDYSNWFTNTKDIITMLDKHGVSV